MVALQLIAPEADAVQETLLGEALEHAPVGAIVLDETGRFLAANRVACRMTGYSRGELLDCQVRDLSADPTGVPARLDEMASGHLQHGTAEVRRRDGTLVQVDFRVGATRSGGLPYFVFVFWSSADDSA